MMTAWLQDERDRSAINRLGGTNLGFFSYFHMFYLHTPWASTCRLEICAQ